ncbi:DUF1854 domain-containing protein, partial [Sphingomonas sp. 10B4]|uniref:DUF1854 domain-containing protein n=1 Tax=Sphingomonas sp. 10B4 TaxID=3048575 RepID=UPI002B2354C5
MHRDPYDRLVLRNEAGEVFEAVSPVRAFPIQSPLEHISLVLSDGREVAWIEALSDLTEAARALVLEELDGREFMPEIEHIS